MDAGPEHCHESLAAQGSQRRHVFLVLRGKDVLIADFRQHFGGIVDNKSRYVLNGALPMCLEFVGSLLYKSDAVLVSRVGKTVLWNSRLAVC